MTGILEFYREAIAKIRHAVEAYRQGLARIDREYAAASDRIARSVASLHEDSARHGTASVGAQREEARLRRQLRTVEQEIAKTDDDIKTALQGIAAVESNIRALGDEKCDLEQQISNRCLVVKLYHFFFEESDDARKQCQELQRKLDSEVTRKSALEEARRRFELQRQQSDAKKAALEEELNDIRSKLTRYKVARGRTAEQETRFNAENQKAAANRRSRKENWLSSCANQWKILAAEINQAAARLRRWQPALVELGPNHLPAASDTPDGLFLGSQKITFEDFTCVVPYPIPFPCPRALVLPENNEDRKRWAHHLLLRLLSSVPPGEMEVTIVDPLALGHSVKPFLPLLKVEQVVPHQRVLTRSDEIETALDRLTNEVEYLIQRGFSNRISNWSEYNASHADTPLRYKVLLLFDVPEQLTDKSLWYLERLCENGPRCGVLPIIAVDEKRMQDRRYDKCRAAIESSAVRIDSLVGNSDVSCDGLVIEYQPEQWPPQEALDQFLSTFAHRCAGKARFSKTLADLWSGYSKGATTINGFDILIGWTPSGESVSLTLGATTSQHHALLAGKTGSGKSNLLHVMIHSLCEAYAPTEVDLYLLDYKESTEFTVYANPPLPHARLIATESDPEFGVTVLQHLVAELEQRARIFKEAGVRDFVEYRKATSQQLRRILLVIDEFQMLFLDTSQVAEASEQLMARLLKQGRSFGIHVLLATQTLNGIKAFSVGELISQLGCRIALACSQEDSARILAGNNWAAADLKSPPEGIINNANGANSANIKFLIPLADSEFCRRHIAKLSERAAKRGFEVKARVFNGAMLPRRPGMKIFQQHCRQRNSLLLGEKLTFFSDLQDVPLITRPAFNVLFSGYSDCIHDGLLSSVLTSLAVLADFDQILYFNGRGIVPGGDFSRASSVCGPRFQSYTDIEAFPLQVIADNIGKQRVAVIIDGLDAEKALHPAQRFGVSRPCEPIPPAELLKQIAEEGPRKGTFVFVFIDNWRRCAGPCKDLINLFELRIGFCMSEDDAAALVSGGIGKFRGIEKPNRAVFVNRMTNEIHWFRPYVARSEDATC